MVWAGLVVRVAGVELGRSVSWRRLVFSVAAGALLVLVFVSAAEARLVFERGVMGPPVPSPNGFLRSSDQPARPTIWVARDDGSQAHVLTSGSWPTISPDGRFVAYTIEPADQEQQLMLIPASGGRSRLLLSAVSVLKARWSPDSKRIAAVDYARATPEGGLVERPVMIDVASGRIRDLATVGSRYSTTFSPDGTQLIYSRLTSASPERSDLYRVPATGGRAVRLTKRGYNTYPVWGTQWVVFSRSVPPSGFDENPKDQLYLVRPSGAGLHRLTYMSLDDEMYGLVAIGWSADGRRLIAEVSGINTGYLVSVDPRTGAVRRIARDGIVGDSLSRDGTTALADDLDGNAVVTVPYRGGPVHMLALNATNSSWTR